MDSSQFTVNSPQFQALWERIAEISDQEAKRRGTVTQRSQRSEHRGHREERKEKPKTQVKNRTWGTRKPKTQAHTPCLGNPRTCHDPSTTARTRRGPTVGMTICDGEQVPDR